MLTDLFFSVTSVKREREREKERERERERNKRRTKEQTGCGGELRKGGERRGGNEFVAKEIFLSFYQKKNSTQH